MSIQKDKNSFDKISDFFRQKPEVTALYIFGSFLTEHMRLDSDIDIGVLLKKKPTDINIKKSEYVDEIIRHTLRGISLIILNTAPVSLRYTILREGRLIFDKYPDLRKEFIELTAREYFDFLPYENIYLKKRLKHIKNG
jgi:predicted nucleotidyltransferase